MPGSLVSATTFDTIDPQITIYGATAWRIRYQSTSAITDQPVEVSGVVLVPGGQAPQGGWPVVAFQHTQLGIAADCGPSLYDGLLNQWGPTSLLLLHGFVVVMTDYEGLGTTGSHPFLNAATLGRNVIDGVRAAGHLRPDIGTRWAAFGGSYGGLATWAANEQATSYGQGLELVGAATWVPLVGMAGLPDKAARRTLTQEQMYVYFLTVMGFRATTHPDLDLARYLHGSMLDRRDLLLVCSGPLLPEAGEVLKNVNPDDLVPVDDQAMREMTQWLADIAVPQQPMAAPMLVIYGSEDPLVDQKWIESAINRACEMGDTVDWISRPGGGYGDIDAAETFSWLRARFDNQKPVNKCEMGLIGQ